ncbi:Tetrathionate reductase subunit B precursor [Pirellulimonas nuda]|uniref:Tetrathionate reductase subunit B n=1 Tax=Pirellulimonas nuda TaxID=2528009 RepID=A0A518DJG9_9BACT|nr:TAT-variant-translocated molybdopterin oxidoreductase [Pirellulimonas nuda]QDU91618.1 Tetrathionate reductase subunit B precursor [Pirellulimonas nuda]
MKHPVASQYWRSLDEIENTPEFQEFLHREFPVAASELPEGVSRRRWMQLMGASFALASVAGCRWETEKIAAFTNRPEGYIPGATERYATNFEWAGAPRHVVVTKFDQRPIKIEGNALHPASLGGTDTYTQAATLSLYDPDRSTYVLQRDQRETFQRSWAEFDAYLKEMLATLGPDADGLAVLMPPTSSLAIHDAMDRLAERSSGVRFYQYSPLARNAELAGAELAFERPLRTHHRFENAKVIATFDADPLVDGAQAVRLAREFAASRDPNGQMSRLYSVESQYSVTGASADHRLPVRSCEIAGVLGEVRDMLAAGKVAEQTDPKLSDRAKFIQVMASDLQAAGTGACVIVGPGQPAAAHAIGHEINSLLGALGSTVELTEEPGPKAKAGTLADLVGDIMAVRVSALVIVGGNPIYDAPANLDVAEALAKAPHSIHLSYYDNETSRACQWSLPEAHPLEVWGDAAAWDGTIGVCQPMIDPLTGGRSALELLTILGDEDFPNAEQLVREAIASRVGGGDESMWRTLLHDGVLADSAQETVSGLTPKKGVKADPNAAGEGPEVVFTRSSSTYDGCLANNGWMQELPDFITKLTWDNAAIMSPATAAEFNAKQGEVVSIKVGLATVEAPTFILPGQADGSIGLALGYGRTAAGHVGGLIKEAGGKGTSPFVNGIGGRWELFRAAANPVGVNVYPLRSSNAAGGSMGFVGGVEVKHAGRSYPLATTQDHFTIDTLGLEAIGQRVGELVREGSHAEYKEHPDFAKHRGAHVAPEEETQLWNALTHDDNRAWGMSIDLNKCVGCNACIVACQSENNVPIVGKDQVARGREMHWIRVDRYFKGFDPETGKYAAQPEVAFQPVACMHCEMAPCEQVCPVAATVHSDEGLNDMVYNRCIGTRYCSNNCPFKVRRFNYFHYTGYLEEANNELMKLVMNPEVTVRSRGVMEKCTYCTQRISAARIDAKNQGRPIRDGEIVTACQQVCPSAAIEFGDLNDKQSRVRKAHDDPRSYGMLAELRVKPRTAYLARVRNPHPLLAPPEPADHGHGHEGAGHGEPENHEDDHVNGGETDKTAALVGGRNGNG